MFAKWFTPRKSQPARKIGRPRLQVEALEDRLAPATLLGLTTMDRLVIFDSASPSIVNSNVAVSGLPVGENLVSIDVRPETGVVYGLSNKNLLYTINPYTGAASQVAGGPASLVQPATRIGIDFNPVVDRLRVVTGTEVNFRIDPNTGTVVGGVADTPLSYGDAKNPLISDVAYDRNFQGATLTTLFGIDSTQNSLVRIGGIDGTPSPNAGALTTVGLLGVNPGANVGFDIDNNGIAYAVMTELNNTGTTRLYTINLTNGAATMVGRIGLPGSTKLFFDGLTTLSREEIIYGVTQSNRLVSFRASTPGQLLSAIPLQDMLANETIRGIDFRPASGELYALTSMNRVVTINTTTGQLTQQGPQIDTTVFSTGFPVGFDFNPQAERLRIVNTDDDNIRYNPLTLAAVSPADTPLAYIDNDPTTNPPSDPNEGDNPNVVAVAYDRNDNAAATLTTLFGIDSNNDTVVRQGAVNGDMADTAGGGSPNSGFLTTIGATGLGVDTTDNVGFDIIDNGTLGNGAALAVMQLNGETVSKLYSIKLSSTTNANQPPLGGATLVGIVGGGEVLTAMAIAPPTIQFSMASFMASEAAGTAKIKITRTGGSGSTATVRFDTVDGTAFAGLDYTAFSNLVVTFNPGETTKTVVINITKDMKKELKETVKLTLTSVTGGSTRLGSLPVANLFISDM